VRQLKDAGSPDIVTPAAVMAKRERPIADAIRRDLADRDFLDLCDAESHATGKQRWTLSLAKVPQDLQTDQTIRHLIGDFAREVASDSAQYRERPRQRPRRNWGTAPVAQCTRSARRCHDGQ
jgi:hypothetical protein